MSILYQYQNSIESFHYFLKNEVFQILEKVMDRLFENVNKLIDETIIEYTLYRLYWLNRLMGF